MGKSKPKTREQLDRATDARLQKSYNITLKDRAYLESLHDGKCWICGLPPVTRGLHVDHDHSWKKVKIEVSKLGDKWATSATYNGVGYGASATKRSLAVRDLKLKLLRASVRGLLCYNHNTAIAKFRDSTDDLISAAEYLTNFKRSSPLNSRVLA
jgi:hypothetical protein